MFPSVEVRQKHYHAKLLLWDSMDQISDDLLEVARMETDVSKSASNS